MPRICLGKFLKKDNLRISRMCHGVNHRRVRVGLAVVASQPCINHFILDKEHHDPAHFMSSQQNINVTPKKQQGLTAFLTSGAQLSNCSGNRKISTGPYRHHTRHSKKKNRESKKIFHDKIIWEAKSKWNRVLHNTTRERLKSS